MKKVGVYEYIVNNKDCLQDFITCGYYDDTDEEFGGLSDCIGYIQEKKEKEYIGIDNIL